MGKKKRGHPDIQDILARPWCYYCERDFEDLKLLISHQKAKHFKCDRCGRRLNTAGGLSVHMNQVHKETVAAVENALPNRQGLDVEIFGMEGVPEDVVQQHNQRIITNFYQEQADRYAATGNPPPGHNAQGRPGKKIKIESPEEIKKRLAEHRARVAQHKAPSGPLHHMPPDAVPDGQAPRINSPAAFASPLAHPGGHYPAVNYAPNLPARPDSSAPGLPIGLPQRPSPSGFPAQSANVTVDDAHGARQEDSIDRAIRMAEAGIRPSQSGTEAAPEALAGSGPAAAVPESSAAATAAPEAAKKGKDKNVKMMYDDVQSPEERLASMARYAFDPEAR